MYMFENGGILRSRTLAQLKYIVQEPIATQKSWKKNVVVMQALYYDYFSCGMSGMYLEDGMNV